MLRTLPRTLVSGALSVARLPVDGLVLVAGRGRLGSTLRLAVDRGDAGLRAAAGTLLRDDALVDEAHRRRQAAEAREHAVRLRQRAENLSAEAEQDVRETSVQAERRRDAAAGRSEERARKARGQAKRTKEGAAEVTRKRKTTARRDAAAKRDRTERAAQQERLEALDKKGEAVAEKEEALAASDEAQRG